MRLLQSILRSFAIGFITFLAVIGYGLGRLRSLFIFNKDRRRSAVSRLRGRIVCWSMATLGATFIKLGQVMSTRPDLFSPEFIEQLRRLQDKLPPFPFRKVRRAVLQELGEPIESRFASFDERPVAAASVAQVHRANLKDGTEVAVKVLRPNVDKKVERDAGILTVLARMMAWHPKLRLSDPVGHLAEFVDGIKKQTDLVNEAKNYERFYVNFADMPEVFFPKIFEEHSSTRVMTMDFVRGSKVDELPPEADRREIATRLRHMFFKMCFHDGFLHADLHPGNMLITADNRIAVFDVGLAKLLTDDLLEQFIDFNRCLAMGMDHDFVNHLKKYHHYMEDVDWDTLAEDVSGFAKSLRGKPMQELEFGGMINDIFALGRKYHVRPVTEMTLILVGVVTAEGIGKMLDPDLDSMAAMADFLVPILMERGMLTAEALQAMAQAHT